MVLRDVVFTKIAKSRIENMNGKVVCFRCGVELKIGDEITVVERKNYVGYNTRRYHRRCFEGLYIG